MDIYYWIYAAWKHPSLIWGGEKEVVVLVTWATWPEFLFVLLLSVDGNISEESGCPRPNPRPGFSLAFERLSRPARADAKQASQTSNVYILCFLSADCEY